MSEVKVMRATDRIWLLGLGAVYCVLYCVMTVAAQALLIVAMLDLGLALLPRAGEMEIVGLIAVGFLGGLLLVWWLPWPTKHLKLRPVAEEYVPPYR